MQPPATGHGLDASSEDALGRTDQTDGTDETSIDENALAQDFASPDAAAAQMARSKRAGGARGGVLGAAMLAIGEIIEPHKAEVTIEQHAETDTDDPLAGLDFGALPPLS